jgi:mono/diheme cytochrome c family protein
MSLRIAALLIIVPFAAGGSCGTTTPTGTTTTTVSFANDILPIFTSRCTGCHGSAGSGSNAPALTTAEAFAAIVNQASVQRPDLNHVSPGSADTSWLFIKVNAAAPGVGVRMPPGGALSAADITTISNWINQGALNN